jgi:hypothetical protein
MEHFPNWVYNLVGNLLEQEDVHPKFYRRTPDGMGLEAHDWCPMTALNLVPGDVKEKARVIQEYKREAERDKSEGSEETPKTRDEIHDSIAGYLVELGLSNDQATNILKTVSSEEFINKRSERS